MARKYDIDENDNVIFIDTENGILIKKLVIEEWSK